MININKINLVIPMAGLGSRFAKAGYKDPKPFIQFEGAAMIEHVMGNLKADAIHYILIGRDHHIQEKREAINKIRQKYDLELLSLNALTEGTACTVLFARELIQNDDPLVIANSDQLVDMDFQGFLNDALERNLDGSILTFQDKTRNPKWSYAKLNVEGLVEQVAEKKPISDLATVGIYYFRRGRDFVDGAIDMIVRNDRVNDEFYTCPVYNYIIGKGKKVGVYSIRSDQMHGLGTPEDLTKYLSR